MNIKEYISSGILEAYALGDLTQQQKAEVEQNLLQYPELKEELLRIEEAQEKLLMKTAIQPRESVKSQLFKKIEDTQSAAKVVPLNTGLNFWRLAAAASISIAIIASYLAYNYRSKWKSTEISLNNLIAQSEQMARDYNQVNERVEKMENEVEVMGNPGFRRVVMKGVKEESLMASVYWNESTSEVYLKIQNLKDLARENQYQLWAIIDGKPVDAGVFDGNVAGLVKMKGIGKGAITFAVTVEPRGGKATPTMEAMQVAGNVPNS